MKAFFVLRSRCKKEVILCRDVWSQLFCTIVQSTVLYGCAVWSLGSANKYCKKIEVVQKHFSLEEWKVELMPLEVEAICHLLFLLILHNFCD
ncbi:hypothetical protein AMTRI_Chr01g135630 [Amborella trichopoda]